MKLLKKAMALTLSLGMVISSMSNVNIMADVNIETMVSSAVYNLARGKMITANPSLQEGKESALTDGSFAGEHAATKFETPNSYYLIDLGKTYDASTLDKLVVGYKENNADDVPFNGYKILYSVDGYYYNEVLSVTGKNVKDQINDNNLIEEEDLSNITGKVRFIKLLYPNSYKYGVQAREIAVLDVDKNAQEVIPDTCDDAESVSVKTNDYNSITYNIKASQNQTDTVYMVYLDGKTIIGNGVKAGEDITVKGIEGGKHTVKVVSVEPGKISEGITSEAINVTALSSLITSKANVALISNNAQAKVTDVSKFYEGHSMSNANKVNDGKLNPGEGTGECLRLAMGGNQHFTFDLGKYYNPSQLDRLLIGYANTATYAATTKVEISKDGINFIKVGESKGFKPENNGKLTLNSVALNNTSDYKEDAFRFVKITLTEGSNNWGYCVVEAGVIMDSNQPTVITPDVEEIENIVAEGAGFNRLKYTIIPSENQNETYSYIVSVNDKIINADAKVNQGYEVDDVATGEAIITVQSVHNGWVSAGVTKKCMVDGYSNYLRTGLNLVYSFINRNVVVTCEKANWNGVPGQGVVKGSQGISAAPSVLVDGVTNNYAHHSGYVQGQPGVKVLDMDFDLGSEFKPNEIKTVLSYFENADRAAKEYEILFSGDGENYERVFYTNKYEFMQPIEDNVDVTSYSQEKVRYVKYRILNGNYGNPFNPDGTIFGGSDSYHICEIGIMGAESLIPDAPTNIITESDGFNHLRVKWDKIENKDATYSIYVDNVLKASGITYEEAGENEFTNIKGGNHKVEVAAVNHNIITKSQPSSIFVTQETTTARPTTARPTVVNPTTINTQPAKGQEEVTKSVTNNEIRLKTPKLKKVSVKKKKISLKLTKVNKATKYEVQYSLKKNMKKAKTKRTSKLSLVITGLKSKKVYYLRTRAVCMKDGTKYYSAWSKPKKTKKVK